MGSILSSISSIGKVAAPVASLASTGYSLYNQYQNQQYQDLLRSYAQNPAKLNAYAQQFTQPLNAGLTTSVANQAQASLAQSGLSDSPQVAQQVYAQAIAPYIQQNQQAGYQDALQALNLGGGAINPATQQANNLAAITKGLSSLGQLGGSGINPAVFAQLMQAGTVQPTQVDTGLDYTPDYSSALTSAPSVPISLGQDSSDY